MTSAASSMHSRRKVQLLVVATVLLLSLGMALSGRWWGQDGMVTLTLQEVIQGPKGAEARFLLHNGSNRSLTYSDLILYDRADQTFNYWLAPGTKKLKAGEEVGCSILVPKGLREAKAEAYLSYHPAPSLRKRVDDALPAWVKFWEDPSVVKWTDFGSIAVSEAFVPQEIIDKAAEEEAPEAKE